MIFLKRLLTSLVLLSVLSLNSEAVTTYTAGVCSTGCEFTLFSSAEDALDNAGDIRNTGSVKCGSWDTGIGSEISNAVAVTWDSGTSTGTLHNMTTSQYILTISSGILDDNDVVTDGTNSFAVNGAPDSCAIDIQCQGNETISETVTVDMSGFTTDADNNVRFSVGPSWRHNGTESTGCVLSSSVGGSVSVLNDSNSYLEWFIIRETATSSGNIDNVILTGLSDTEMYFRNNIIDTPVLNGNGAYAYVMNLSSTTSSGKAYATNNIIYDGTETTIGIKVRADFGRTIEADNNTVYNMGSHGFSTDTNGTSRAKNNLSFNNGGSEYAGTWDTFTTNGSSDTTGTAGLQNLVSTTELVNPSVDMHLKSGAVSIDAGTDLVTTPAGVNIDIDNRNRDAMGDTWDLGADEYVVSLGAGRRVIIISKKEKGENHVENDIESRFEFDRWKSQRFIIAEH